MSNADLAALLIIGTCTTIGLLILVLLVVLRRSEPKPRPRRFRPVPRRVVTPAEVAADPLLSDIAAMLSYHHLHVRWDGYEFRKLDTEQRDLWADLIDADHVNDPGSSDPDEEPWLVDRWWHDDYTEKTSR